MFVNTIPFIVTISRFSEIWNGFLIANQKSTTIIQAIKQRSSGSVLQEGLPLDLHPNGRPI
jgi:hypothetical protein